MASVSAARELALSFVRNNPFVQNDLATTAKRHYPSSSTTRGRLASAPPTIAAPTVVVVRDRTHDPTGALTPSEIEYGPGIVRKLREKFSHLADTASKDANISTYTRHKRFPSVDDLLADEPPSKVEEKRLSREHSKSIGSLAELEEQDRQDLYNNQSATLAQKQQSVESSHDMAVESMPTPPLSILRQKFELSSGGGMRPKRNTKLAGLIMDRRAQNQKLQEPEFVAVSKKLRPVSVSKSADSQDESAGEEPSSPYKIALRPAAPPTPVILEKDVKLVVDVSSPPDPAVNGHAKGDYKFIPERHQDLTDRSPPPEEPRPPVFDDEHNRSMEQPQTAREDDDDDSELSSDDETSYDVSPVKAPSTTSVIVNDGSGIGEMQQLLNKFNSIRERKSSEDAVATVSVVQAEKPPPVSAPAAKPPPVSEPVVKPPLISEPAVKPPLVSMPTGKPPVGPRSNGHATVIEISTEDSPKRKSLSAQFLESKQKQTQKTNVAEEKQPESAGEQHHTVHIEHVAPHSPVEVAHHPGDIYPPEITAIDHYDRFAHVTHEQVQIAGDGNPVRHSLLSLVSEEDVPLLLEAMAERFHFVFEDLNNNNSDGKGDGLRPVASSLVRRGQPRRADPKKNGVTGVCFATDPPSAFAYLDENGAIESDEWVEGVRISFDEYERICAEEREDYANKRLELLKWQAALISQQEGSGIHTPLVNGGLTAFVPSQLSTNEYELGVTNRFSYGDANSNNSPEQRLLPDRPSAVVGQSGDDNVDVRPIDEEADSFSQVENASDLLF